MFGFQFYFGLLFTAVCVFKDSVDGAFTCPTMFNFYPDANDCTKFYRCMWGKTHSFNCPAGTRWSQKILTCDHAHNVKCNKKPVLKPTYDIISGYKLQPDPKAERPDFSVDQDPAEMKTQETKIKTLAEKFAEYQLSLLNNDDHENEADVNEREGRDEQEPETSVYSEDYEYYPPIQEHNQEPNLLPGIGQRFPEYKYPNSYDIPHFQNSYHKFTPSKKNSKPMSEKQSKPSQYFEQAENRKTNENNHQTQGESMNANYKEPISSEQFVYPKVHPLHQPYYEKHVRRYIDTKDNHKLTKIPPFEYQYRTTAPLFDVRRQYQPEVLSYPDGYFSRQWYNNGPKFERMRYLPSFPSHAVTPFLSTDGAVDYRVLTENKYERHRDPSVNAQASAPWRLADLFRAGYGYKRIYP